MTGSRTVALRRIALVALIALGPSACVPAGQGSGPPDGELTIFGAASLRSALDAISVTYEAEAGVRLTVSTDSSAALATQIEQGAPADVFLAADAANPRRLADAGLTDGEPMAFARNAVRIIVPSGDPGAVATPADLARPGVRIVAAGDAVPIARYAAELVEQLAAVDGYPADFAAAYARNVVSKEDNVAAVVARIELGEGDAAIVYATDALAAASAKTVELPAGVGVSARYAGVVVGASSRRAAARAFLGWLVGPRGQAVLARSGFLPADP